MDGLRFSLRGDDLFTLFFVLLSVKFRRSRILLIEDDLNLCVYSLFTTRHTPAIGP